MKLFTSGLGLLASLAPAMAVVSYQEPDAMLNFNMYTVTEGSNTDLHINMSIPASHGWGAIGVGEMMPGALMFILLPDTNGSVISVRSPTGYVMPMPLSGVDFEMVSGSVTNDVMMASGICKGCQQWNGGTLNAASTAQPFLWAVGPGTSGVSGTGAKAMIMKHSRMGNFALDMTKAAEAPTAAGSSSPSSSGGNSGVSGAMTVKAVDPMMLVAHATLLTLSFLLIFPVATILLRAPGIGSWKTHAALNTLGFMLVVAGMGIAISMSMGTTPKFSKFMTGHQGVGLTATSLVILQWLLGIAHHAGFAKFQKRWALTWVHLAVGPLAMLLGAINPVLGFLLTMKRSASIGVGVVGLFIWFATFAFAWTMGGIAAKKQTKPAVADAASSNSERGMNPEQEK